MYQTIESVEIRQLTLQWSAPEDTSKSSDAQDTPVTPPAWVKGKIDFELGFAVFQMMILSSTDPLARNAPFGDQARLVILEV